MRKSNLYFQYELPAGAHLLDLRWNDRSGKRFVAFEIKLKTGNGFVPYPMRKTKTWYHGQLDWLSKQSLRSNDLFRIHTLGTRKVRYATGRDQNIFQRPSTMAFTGLSSGT